MDKEADGRVVVRGTLSPHTSRRGANWRMKLTKAIDQFTRDLQSAGKAASTCTAYESDLRRLAAMSPIDTVLAFTPDLIRTFLHVQSAGNIKMATLHRRMAALSQFAKWGIRQRLWTSNPVDQFERIKKPKTLPRPFTKDEVERLLALDLSPRERVLRALLFFTGLRVTPICGIKVGDISYDPPTIRATVKGAKTQVIPMHPELKELVYSYTLQYTDLKGQSFLVAHKLNRPLRRRSVERLTGFWGARAKVADCKPHRFRHTFATTLLQQGVDIRIIKDAMGHEDISSTMIYTKVTEAAVESAIQRLPWKQEPLT